MPRTWRRCHNPGFFLSKSMKITLFHPERQHYSVVTYSNAALRAGKYFLPHDGKNYILCQSLYNPHISLYNKRLIDIIGRLIIFTSRRDVNNIYLPPRFLNLFHEQIIRSNIIFRNKICPNKSDPQNSFIQCMQECLQSKV